jgi:hypothetical protein
MRPSWSSQTNPSRAGLPFDLRAVSKAGSRVDGAAAFDPLADMAEADTQYAVQFPGHPRRDPGLTLKLGHQPDMRVVASNRK